ncbi:MAG: RNA methyltransferase [Synechococcales cyanobacterium]
MGRLRVVLVEPQGSRNLGSVARVMKNMGVGHLVVVNPRCDPRDVEARHMAVHAQDVLDRATVVSTLAEALQGCDRTIGTLGRIHPTLPEWAIGDPRRDVPWLLAGQDAALVFGPEDRGLSNQELALCQRQVSIPTHPDYCSLNLAQAVGICLYEVWLAQQQPTTLAPGLPPTSPSTPVASHNVMESFFGQLQDLLLEIGYLSPQTQGRKMQKFRALFNRAQPSPAEVALLRGILRQWQWYTRHQITEAQRGEDQVPADPGLAEE